MEQDNILGNNIRFLRLKKKMSMNDLAGVLDLSGQTGVFSYESGHCKPTVDRLIIISRFFKVSLDSIVFEKIYERKILQVGQKP